MKAAGTPGPQVPGLIQTQPEQAQELGLGVLMAAIVAPKVVLGPRNWAP